MRPSHEQVKVIKRNATEAVDELYSLLLRTREDLREAIESGVRMGEAARRLSQILDELTALSSTVEHRPLTPGVDGSNPSAPATFFDALMDSTVSASGLEIRIVCGNHDTKDAILDYLIGAATTA